jgi:hypothetical protein
LLPPLNQRNALCYICAMILKNLALAAALLFLACAPAMATAQATKSKSTAHPTTAPSTTDSPATQSTAGPVTTGSSPEASPASGPDGGSPVPNSDCQGSACDAPPPSHISIATPAPAPAPWPVQERISWVANLILVLIVYFGVMLGYSALRKIERQAHVVEVAAQAAADSAKAVLLLAQAQERAERPWIMVTAEPDPGIRDCFSVMATNRGHSPTKIVTLVDSIATANDESQLPAEPVFHAEPRPPRDPIFLLPGESRKIKSFRRDDVQTVCNNPEDLRRVEDWEVKIFLYGKVAYADLRVPEDDQAHETSWCCWYIHGRQNSGMVMAGPLEYNRHT